MPEEINERRRKYTLLVIIALLVAFIAVLLAQNAQDTADINNVFMVVVNNTNLAPAVAGHPPGTGERVSGTTYWANTSPIQIMVFAHAMVVGDNAEIHLLINGSKVADTSGRPLGGAETSNKTIVAIIPKGANYSVEFQNFHHYEWREYPILSGKNGTLSINQSLVGSSFNSTYHNTTNTFNFYNSTQAFPNSSITALQNNDTNTAYTNIRNFFILNQTINGIEINKSGAKSRVFLDQLQGLNISLWGENMYFTNFFYIDDTNIPGWMIAEDTRPEQDSIFMYHATAGANPRTATAIYTFGNKTLSTISNLSLNPTIKPTCITMYSPDGTAYRFTIANGGGTNVAAGVCG